MLKNTLRRLRNLCQRARRPSPGRPFRRQRSLPLLEPLEDRVLLAVNSFINPSGGAWEDPANWSAGAVPVPLAESLDTLAA